MRGGVGRERKRKEEEVVVAARCARDGTRADMALRQGAGRRELEARERAGRSGRCRGALGFRKGGEARVDAGCGTDWR